MSSTVKTRLQVKVVAGASRTEISGWLGDVLKIRIAKQPEKGRANREVESLLCNSLGIARRSVRIVSGKTAARKVLEIEGLSVDDVRQKLGSPT